MNDRVIGAGAPPDDARGIPGAAETDAAAESVAAMPSILEDTEPAAVARTDPPDERGTHAPTLVADEAPATDRPKRLLSLDAFRGLTIILMLLVNNIALGTATPAQFQHAPWRGGIHLADLVFPWFLLCVGLAVPFSAASFRRRGLPSWRYDLRILGRATALLALGCLVSSSIERRPVFGLGVLQLIGLAYLCGALLYDLPSCRRLLIAGFLLGGYGAALRLLPVPGYGVGPLDEDRNLVAYVNAVFLEPVHLRGLLSVIPTTALVLIGTGLGDLLRRRDLGVRRTLAHLVMAGGALTALGVLWNISQHYSKTLWTPAYILFTAGTGTLTFAVLHLVVEAAGHHRWSYPLQVMGANAILAYVGQILAKTWILSVYQVGVGDGTSVSVSDWYLRFWVTHVGRVGGGWLHTATFIGLCWLVLWLLYRKRVFLRV